MSEDEQEAESDVGSGDGTDDASSPASVLHAEPSARLDTSTQALRLIARLGCAFNALLLARPLNGQYKRVAGDNSSGSFPVPDEPQRIPGRVVGDHLIGMDMPSAISFLLISIFDRVLSSYAPTVSPFRPFSAIVVFFPVSSIPRAYYHYSFRHAVAIVCTPLVYCSIPHLTY